MPTKKTKNSWQKNSPFDSICFHDDEGKEYWSSRELAKVLEYEDFRNFLSVLEKAKIACNNSDFNIDDHFVDVTEMIALAKGAQREVTTTLLSRYACYLIVQKGWIYHKSTPNFLKMGRFIPSTLHPRWIATSFRREYAL